MKKIISRIFIRIFAVSLVLLSFKKDVFAQFNDPSLMTTGGLPTQSLSSTVLNGFGLLNNFLLLPFSLLFLVFFYVRYFLLRNKSDELSKVKTQKFLRKGKIFLIISIISISLAVFLKGYIF